MLAAGLQGVEHGGLFHGTIKGALGHVDLWSIIAVVSLQCKHESTGSGASNGVALQNHPVASVKG